MSVMIKTSRSYRTILLIALPAALILLACNAVTQGLNTPTPQDCSTASNSPSGSDLDYALEFTSDIFEGSQWDESHQVLDERVTVTWRNASEFSITHMEYVVFPCGYNQESIDWYFSQSNFEEVIFQSYEDLQIGKTCSKSDTLLLKEFAARSGGLDYDIRYWIVLEQPDRILDIFIAYPTDQKATLDSYANELFPSLAACQE